MPCLFLLILASCECCFEVRSRGNAHCPQAPSAGPPGGCLAMMARRRRPVRLSNSAFGSSRKSRGTLSHPCSVHERPTRWVVTSRGYENVGVVVLNLAKFKTFWPVFRLAATSTVPLLRYNISAWLDRGKKDASLALTDRQVVGPEDSRMTRHGIGAQCIRRSVGHGFDPHRRRVVLRSSVGRAPDCY